MCIECFGRFSRDNVCIVNRAQMVPHHDIEAVSYDVVVSHDCGRVAILDNRPSLAAVARTAGVMQPEKMTKFVRRRRRTYRLDTARARPTTLFVPCQATALPRHLLPYAIPPRRIDGAHKRGVNDADHAKP